MKDIRYKAKRISIRLVDGAVRVRTYIKGWVWGETIIHVIGDSHALAYRAWSPFVVHYLGPATMHNLFAANSHNRTLSKLKRSLRWVNRNRDKVLMVFGEIDCRIHFYYQYKKRRGEVKLSKLIQTTIERFLEGVVGLEQERYEVIIQGIAAPGKETNKYGYPDYAEDKIKVMIYREFNRQLKLACKHKGLDYWEIYWQTADSEGFMKPDMAEDKVHLKSEALKRVVESEYHDRLPGRNS